ncbi:MAG: fructose 1,6-bisphosphatase [Thaumarchaeota archaeon]|nr:fructose 1,6-bisphosphatase [Nitrososphaerota archaeon]
MTDATLRVQDATSRIVSDGDRAKKLGVGASGDKTLLADREAEKAMLNALSGLRGLRVLSEEAGEVGDPRSQLAAIVDPLDGSANFMRGVPFYCTSVAVATGNSLDSVNFGIIRNLVNGDVYMAGKGSGATKNGSRIRTSSTAKASESVVGIDLSRATPELVSELQPLISGVNRSVHFGANALELCYLAEGKLDAFVDVRGRIRVTDIAAGFLIAAEAGASIWSSPGPGDRLRLDLTEKFSMVGSSNPTLHEEVMRLCGRQTVWEKGT